MQSAGQNQNVRRHRDSRPPGPKQCRERGVMRLKREADHSPPCHSEQSTSLYSGWGKRRPRHLWNPMVQNRPWPQPQLPKTGLHSKPAESCRLSHTLRPYNSFAYAAPTKRHNKQWSDQWRYKVPCAYHTTHNYVIFSLLLLLPICWVQLLHS
jgi:hypothetical protein